MAPKAARVCASTRAALLALAVLLVWSARSAEAAQLGAGGGGGGQGALGPVPVRAETRIVSALGGASSPAFRADEPIPPVVYATPRMKPSQPLPVSKSTRILTVKDFLASDPKNPRLAERHVWTPDGKAPAAGSDLARALDVARRSFVIADVAETGTRMSVFYLESGGRVRPVEFGLVSSEQPLGASCTGLQRDNVGGIPTDLELIAVEKEPLLRADRAVDMLTALYVTCRATVRQALVRPNKAVLGALEQLKPSAKRGADVNTMVRTWFNNVDVFIEGDGALRRLAERLALRNAGDVDSNLWSYVSAVDANLRQNSGHFHARVLPGSWQGYLGFMAAWDYVTRHQGEMNVDRVSLRLAQLDAARREAGGSEESGESSEEVVPDVPDCTRDNVVFVGIGEVSTEVAFTVAEESVARLLVDRAEEDGAAEAEAEVEAAARASLLEVGSRVRGPMKLLYGMRDRVVHSKSFFGAGRNSALRRALESSFVEYRPQLQQGETVPVACLSSGVLVDRRAVGDPTRSLGPAICFANKGRGAEGFQRGVCEDLSDSVPLLGAVIEGRVLFNGTGDSGKCAEQLRASLYLNGSDDHSFPNRFRPQWDALTHGDRLNLRSRSHIVLSNEEVAEAFAAAVRHARALAGANERSAAEDEESTLSAVDKDTDAELRASKRILRQGLFFHQIEALAHIIGSPRFSKLPVDQLGSGDFDMPLLANLVMELLARLGVDERWPGKIHFVPVDWVDGAAAVYGAALAAGDARYQRFYSSQTYVVSESATEDVEDWPLLDDAAALKPNRV
jgi:hypothetical protein